MVGKPRCAHNHEFRELERLLQAAFKEDEAELFDFLVRNDPALTPDAIRVATVDDRPVACSIALAREMRTLHGTWVPGFTITLVACDPVFEGRGFGSLAVRDSLAYAARSGAHMAVLYGHPGYYPRFGFVPVLPATIAMLDVGAPPGDGRKGEPAEGAAAATESGPPSGWRTSLEGRRISAGLHGPLPGDLVVREAQDSDVPYLLHMYESQLAGHPCGVRRDDSSWIWRPRGDMPGRTVFVFCLKKSGQAVGYSFCLDRPDRGYLTVMEAAARDRAVASGMVSELAAQAAGLGRKHLRISMSPDSLVMQAALGMGAAREYRPASAGMVCVLRWEGLLPEGYVVEATEDRPADGLSQDDTFHLFHRGVLVLTAKRAPLTQLVLGYEDVDSLAGCGDLMSDCEPPMRGALRRDFPKSYPAWYLAPYWY